jgi:hypothetical protein
VGAVQCKKHGLNVAGPFCCDHVRKAVTFSMPFIPFGVYRADILGDGTLIARHMLCSECASKYGLSVDVVVTEEVWDNDERFPYVCPVCAPCFKEWSAQERVQPGPVAG